MQSSCHAEDGWGSLYDKDLCLAMAHILYPLYSFYVDFSKLVNISTELRERKPLWGKPQSDSG